MANSESSAAAERDRVIKLLLELFREFGQEILLDEDWNFLYRLLQRAEIIGVAKIEIINGLETSSDDVRVALKYALFDRQATRREKKSGHRGPRASFGMSEDYDDDDEEQLA